MSSSISPRCRRPRPSSAAAPSDVSSRRCSPTWARPSPSSRRLPAILTGCDTEVANVVGRSFKKRGIEIRTGVNITGHTPKKGSTTIAVEGGDDVTVDMVVMSVGRRPRTEGLVADGTGVEINDRGFVVADGHQRTANPHVYAVGDVVANTPQLAHVGFAEAIVAIKTILGEPSVPVDYDRVPWAIYSNPEVAFCGLTEASAKEKGYEVVVKKDPFGGNSRAQIIGDTEGVVKIIAEKRADGTRRADPGRAHGRSVGDRATRRRVLRRQLGSHRRRGRRADPTAPIAVRDLR